MHGVGAVVAWLHYFWRLGEPVSVASALIASQHFQMQSPVTVITRGGELRVEFDEGFKEVFLTGPAEVVYEGVIKTKEKIQKKKDKR